MIFHDFSGKFVSLNSNLMKKNFFSLIIFLVPVILFAQEGPLWMRNPAISPDGKIIVFNYQGDLYTVDARGGEADILTYHPAWDGDACWSPDGQMIAFRSQRYGSTDGYIIPAEGGVPKRMTTHSSSVKVQTFSPDSKELLYVSHLQDDPKNAEFPTGLFPETYSVSVEGGRPHRVLATTVLNARYSKDGRYLIYNDVKGYEDEFRKHHTSSVTRDIWIYDSESGKHTRLTSWEGEDRNPVFSPDEKTIYYLSEGSGSMNIWAMPREGDAQKRQVTNFQHHPLRGLSISDEGTLCFSYNGEIYTGKDGGEFTKVPIQITGDLQENPVTFMKESKGATEYAISKDGKQMAFIIRGEVFVTATDYNTTRRITNTPQQERSVSFSPDGRSLLYASERDSSWNIYQTSIVNDDEPNFANATLLKEEVVVATEKEEFQPAWSPDGKEVAYLEERECLKVINLESKESRTILPGKYNYSYSDGDQHYEWSPDGKWFLVDYTTTSNMNSDVALVDAEGRQEIHNLTPSGYFDGNGRWGLKGKMMYFFSDRSGYRSHGSWGSESDIYGLFFTKEANDEFRRSKEERELDKEMEKEKKESEKEDDGKKKKDKKKEDESPEPLEFDLKNIDHRMLRLTVHSSRISDAEITPDGTKMFYVSQGDDGFNLWVQDFVEKETKMLLPLKSKRYIGLLMDEKGENLFVYSSQGIYKVDVKSTKKKPVSYMAEFYLDKQKEREYMFEHVWRQVQKKFYDPELHGVDWDFYKAEYSRFLPYINNGYDFSAMLSEMLGELNASHTGARYYERNNGADATASLGLFYDFNAGGDGLPVEEVILRGPFDRSDSRLEAGMIIEKIDGTPIVEGMDYFPLLNHKAGKLTLVSIYDPESGERWDETIKPISFWQEYALLYERWIEQRSKETEELSGGRIGYVHVKGMNSASFRKVYSDVLGKHYHKEALVVDTRFNGGGWLHDDLATFLSGTQYASFWPRGHENFGHEPLNKWIKPSVVIISESNYSDAHGFPFAYRALGIGETVGMPVPGTMTAVWWETLQDKSTTFGIPQLGVKDMEGNYMENYQFEPDHKVALDKEVVITGRDQQLEKAVEVLLEQLDQN